MIKNVVFDFGQVLVHFEPLYMTQKYIPNESDAKLAADIIFDRLYWDKLDEGTISEDEVIAAIAERLPTHLSESGIKAYKNWIYNIPEIEGMRALIEKIKKEKGVHVFVLSNISLYFAEHAHEISILKEAEKCIFSSVCGYIKPHADIFDHLCKECGILPSETLFIDDNQKNIDGARAFGIHAYQFDGDVEALNNYLAKIL